MSSAISVTPTYCPAKTLLRLILRLSDADPAAVGHQNGSVVEGVLRMFRRPILTCRGCVQLARIETGQGLVGSGVVIHFYEVVESFLLLQEIIGRRHGSLFFQSQMHAFMTAILLRVARLDPFDRDAETQPHTESLLKPNRVCGQEKGMP